MSITASVKDFVVDTPVKYWSTHAEEAGAGTAVLAGGGLVVGVAAGVITLPVTAPVVTTLAALTALGVFACGKSTPTQPDAPEKQPVSLDTYKVQYALKLQDSCQLQGKTLTDDEYLAIARMIVESYKNDTFKNPYDQKIQKALNENEKGTAVKLDPCNFPDDAKKETDIINKIVEQLKANGANKPVLAGLFPEKLEGLKNACTKGLTTPDKGYQPDGAFWQDGVPLAITKGDLLFIINSTLHPERLDAGQPDAAQPDAAAASSSAASLTLNRSRSSSAAKAAASSSSATVQAPSSSAKKIDTPSSKEDDSAARARARAQEEARKAAAEEAKARQEEEAKRKAAEEAARQQTGKTQADCDKERKNSTLQAGKCECLPPFTIEKPTKCLKPAAGGSL